MFTATRLQLTTYLLGVCLFSICFLVFLNASVAFVITDVIKQREGVGDAVGTLGFADELVALVACPLWGILSDRIGVRTVCVLGYCIVGLSLFLFVQASNVFPELLLARLLFSVGGAAVATMVTAILPSMTALHIGESEDPAVSNLGTRNRPVSSSGTSDLTVTPARIPEHASQPTESSSKDVSSVSRASPTRTAGFVGLFTGGGALLALFVFLPLPAHFQNNNMTAKQALKYTYYVVGAIAFVVAFVCLAGLRNLRGEHGKTWRAVFPKGESDNSITSISSPSYWQLLSGSIRLGFQDSLIGLGYIGGFVARASSVGISLFIPLFVNAYFISSGRCTTDDAADIKSQCRVAYILAAELTGTSQLVALAFAPVFGFLADRYRRFHLPMLGAALSGIIGFSGFAVTKDPDPASEAGSAWIFVVMAFIGIGQIGAIVCSLGLLGRGISGLEAQKSAPGRDCSSSPLDDGEANLPSEELQGLLNGRKSVPRSLNHLKGSIAGVYSLAGGAGILLLTKLGGLLFDRTSTASPFVMLALFNTILFVAVLASSMFRSS